MIPASPASGRRQPPDSADPTRVLAHPAGQHWQFRTSSLLWLTFTAAMTLAYARLYGPWAMGLVLAAPLAAVAIGSWFGLMLGRMQDAVYWAVVGSLLGSAFAVQPQVQGLMFYIWPLLFSVVGAFAATQSASVRFRLIPLCAAAGLLTVWLVYATRLATNTDGWVDIVCGGLAGAAMSGLVGLVDWLQATYRTPRDAWAAGLVFAVIAGNLWAAFVTGQIGLG
ncbi:MAG: hypothetical protein L0211_03000 [Planctomycetaceae bacterium]|nr:hypothetical protein [Planctomycetaceae bacterium]